MRARGAAGLAVLIACSVPPAPAEPLIEQPRSYGHVIGDVLTQRIALEGGSHPEIPVLPMATRVDTWFERLPPRVEKDRQARSWLRIDYQMVNSPRDLLMDTLPALNLATKSGRTTVVPAWPVSISPLTPDEVFGKGDMQAMQSDRAAMPYPTHAIRRRLQLWAGLACLTLAAWLVWFVWRNWRDASRLPFARAAREVQRLGGGVQPGGPEGWVALHRAFNAAAGRVIHAESLPALFARASYLEPLRPDIEQFYAASSERFFARAPAASALPLVELSRRLRRAEKLRSGGARNA